MKVYKFIPILAVALLIPSFVAAEHSDRGRSRQYTERDHDRYPSNRATFGHRAGYDRGHDRDYDRGHGRGYDRGRHHNTTYRRRQHGHHDDHYYDHHGHDRYGHSRQGSHRRSRRGVHFGGVIVIRF